MTRNQRAAHINDLHRSDCWDATANVPRWWSIQSRTHADTDTRRPLIHFDPADPQVVIG
jgi:hypothetical protein